MKPKSYIFIGQLNYTFSFMFSNKEQLNYIFSFMFPNIDLVVVSRRDWMMPKYHDLANLFGLLT